MDLDQSKYTRSDMWLLFFNNKITKQAEAEKIFESTYRIKINTTIKLAIKEELKRYVMRVNIQKKKTSAERNEFPAPIDEKVYLTVFF